MSTTLKTYNWDKPSVLTQQEKAKAVYPWDEWFDGSIRRLRQTQHFKPEARADGTIVLVPVKKPSGDFKPHPLMMERIIRTRATGKGVRVQIRHEPLNKADTANPFGILVLQAVGANGKSQPRVAPPESPAAKRAATKAATTKAAAKKAPAKKTPAKKAAAPAAAKATSNGEAAKAPSKAAKRQPRQPTKAAAK